MNQIPANPASADQRSADRRSAAIHLAQTHQVWHIFCKDLRHHWREIAASLALLAGFMWIEVHEWARNGVLAVGANAYIDQVLPGLIVPLVPISWIFLVVRAVQGESLVGDRQFWVTRPYDWTKLAAAKALFVLTFINLPLLLVDILLLALAGFPPFHYLGGLLWMQAIWIVLLILPAAALAAVTASIGQILLAMLFVALFAIGMGVLAGQVPSSSFAGDVGGLYIALILVTACVVLLLQYSRRKTGQSRLLIAGLAVAFVLVMVATPYRTLISRAYPLAGSPELPLQLALMPAQRPTPDEAIFTGDQVPLRFPLSVSGLPKDSLVEVNGAILTLTNAQGAHWDSGWEGSNALLFPDQKTTDQTFYIKREVFDQIKSSPVQAKLLLAFALYHDSNQRQFVVPRGEFSLPQLGFCRAGSARWNSVGTLSCRVPLRSPQFLLITSEVAASTCPLSKNVPPANPGELARGALQNHDGGAADAGISPVHELTIYLSEWNSPNSRITPGICPGTPLTLSDPEEISRSRVELQFDNLPLADYQQSSGNRH
jgi:hypothetical protein